MPDSASPHAHRPVPDAPWLQVHLVSHTHWDREWYHTAGRFRQRLVPLIDTLLARPIERATPFLLDGQAILLADFLSVRPDQETALRAHLAAGVLEAGPWYVLADNLIPSGEAVVRNLQAGARLLSHLGAQSPRVAYCPDTFGHPAMLPAIAAEFGFDVAIVWRGVGGASHPARNTMWWSSADGQRVLLHHLPPDGYEVGSALPADVQQSRERWTKLAEHWRTRPGTGVVLLPNGADHHALQHDRDAAVASLAAVARVDAAVVRDSTLLAFAEALVQSARDLPLPTVSGELRDSYGYTWTLQGTFGTRAAQKRTNARLERALLHDVEPWMALAWLHPSRVWSPMTSPHDASSNQPSPQAEADVTDARSALLSHAWEALLRTHPHDTLCGCSTDAVALAMDDRQRAVCDMLPGLRHDALQRALGHDPVAARSQSPLDSPPVMIRNRGARTRGGIAEVRLIETLGDVRVGPGSAGHAMPRAYVAAPTPDIPGVLMQAGRTSLTHARRESPQHYPDDDLVREHRALAWVPPVPAHGVRVMSGEAEAPSQELVAPRLVTMEAHDDVMLLDNGAVRVECSLRGVSMRVGDRTLRHALSLESTTDAGDSYTASLRGAPQALRLVRMTAGARGPLRASVVLRWILDSDAPASLDAKSMRVPSDIGSMTEGGTPRTRRNGGVRVDTELILDAESRLLRCDVRGVNRRRDHRLRLCWHTDVVNDASVPGQIVADAAFGPVQRAPIIATAKAEGIESIPRTMPMHRWITCANPMRGATLLSDGLAEVEPSDGTLSLTLVRAIGELSRGDLPERPGHAGWPCATPRSQSLGAFRARAALLVHEAWSDTTLEQLEEAADAFLLPLRGETWRDYRAGDGGYARSLAGPELIGRGLRASAVSLSADGQALLLRAVNLTERPLHGEWRLPHDGPWHVTRTRLDETALEPARTLASASLTFSASPRAIVTLLVRRV